MTDRELMQQALEALEFYTCGDEIDEALITALKERLAQPEQEPVACKTLCELCVKRGYSFCVNAAQTTPIPSPQPAQQEPVAWSWEHDGRVVNAFPFKPNSESEYWRAKGWTTRPLVYGDTAPQRREWVGLTNEAIWLEYQRFWPFHPVEEPRLAKDIVKLARAIEAKLREKNA